MYVSIAPMRLAVVDQLDLRDRHELKSVSHDVPADAFAQRERLGRGIVIACWGLASVRRVDHAANIEFVSRLLGGV